MFSHIKELFTRPSGYSISRSVRLRSSASAYFNRTPASATNRTTWTWSGWVKRGSLGTAQMIFQANAASGTTDNDRFLFYFNSSNQLEVDGALQVFRVTNAVFRDPSAWYHIVLTVDTGNATTNNRMLLYVNGVSQSFSTNYALSSSQLLAVNGIYPHYFSYLSGSSFFFDGYLTEINFIDGQALTPSSFGETDSITGVWKAKKYSGTYGTNGFYLNFSDNSNNTAATIGKDYSGNGNNWTPNNVQTYDSVPDTPSNNFCVMNPLYNGGSGTSWSNGNLTSTIAVSQSGITASTFGISSGKWYWEVCASPSSPPSLCVGIIKTSFTPIGDVFLGYQSEGYGYYSYDGRKVNNSSFSTYGSSWEGAQYVIGIALDMDAGTVTFYRNNVSQGTAFSSLSGTFTFAASDGGATAGTTFYVNFGADSSFAGQKTAQTNKDANGLGNFFYAVPSGYLALCTQNLPASTITNGAGYMAATTYTGNGSTQSITNTVGSTSFQPDLVWAKNRTNAIGNALFDSVRGTGLQIVSNSTGAETNEGSFGVSAFNSNGFNVGSNSSVNQSTAAMVAWQWKAGGTSSSNTNGSITSTVSVGATQGFSVATYTGNGSAGATFGHGLGVAPSFVIIKERGNANGWLCYHISTGNTGYLELDATLAFQTLSTVWNNTTPSSTVVTLGTVSNVNRNGGTFVAYCFAAVKGFSAFGSYTGNGSADGPFVFTGFRPRFVLVKDATTAGGYWEIHDTSRSTYNATTARLWPNVSSAEATGADIDFLSNGFKVRTTDGTVNNSGSTVIYAAFAENPFRNALAR